MEAGVVDLAAADLVVAGSVVGVQPAAAAVAASRLVVDLVEVPPQVAAVAMAAKSVAAVVVELFPGSNRAVIADIAAAIDAQTGSRN